MLGLARAVLLVIEEGERGRTVGESEGVVLILSIATIKFFTYWVKFCTVLGEPTNASTLLVRRERRLCWLFSPPKHLLSSLREEGTLNSQSQEEASNIRYDTLDNGSPGLMHPAPSLSNRPPRETNNFGATELEGYPTGEMSAT